MEEYGIARAAAAAPKHPNWGCLKVHTWCPHFLKGASNWLKGLKVVAIQERNFALRIASMLFHSIPYTIPHYSLLFHTSVPSRVRNLRKMRNFWANFTDFEPEINITKCKTEKLKQKI